MRTYYDARGRYRGTSYGPWLSLYIDLCRVIGFFIKLIVVGVALGLWWTGKGLYLLGRKVAARLTADKAKPPEGGSLSPGGQPQLRHASDRASRKEAHGETFTECLFTHPHSTSGGGEWRS